jgi:hypothetical protein
MEIWLSNLQIVCLDLSEIHSSCGPKFWSNACIVSLPRICSPAKPDFKNSYQLICMSKLVIWVTRRKLGSLAASFIYKVSGKVMEFFLPKTWFIQEGQFCPEILIQRPVEFPIPVTHKSLIILGHLMDHWKAEKVTYHLVFGTSRVSANLRPKR